MDTLSEEYAQLIDQRAKIIDSIQELEQKEIIKEYFALKKQNDSLYTKQLEIRKKILEEEYDTCNHILVYSQIEHDRYEGRTYKSCGCIKCGLDNSVLSKDKEWLSFTGKVMYDYLRHHYLSGIATSNVCDLDLAQAIYSKIKEAHPDITDELAIKYFEIALNNIRDITVSEERKANRAKRLSLHPSFERWYSRDVHCD